MHQLTERFAGSTDFVKPGRFLIREGTLVRTATVAQTVLNSTRRWRKAGSAARLMVRLRSSSSAEPEPEPEPEADDAEEEEEEPEVSEADALLQWFNAAFEEAYGELEDCFKAGGVEFLGCELHACLRVAFVRVPPYSLAFLLFRSLLINIILLNVAMQAERCSGVVAVDLNLGCPQRSAQAGHFGAFLCDPVDRKLLLSIVSTLSRSLRVPFFCKIRLLNELEDTLEFAHRLQDAGCSLLAVHGRYRGSPMHRRDGPAHLDQIAAIKQRLSIPVITNGNVRNAAELVRTHALTQSARTHLSPLCSCDHTLFSLCVFW